MSSFGENVRARRIELGMTLRKVEAASGVSNGYISQIELHDMSVGLDKAIMLAAALQTDVYALAGFTLPEHLVIDEDKLLDREREVQVV